MGKKLSVGGKVGPVKYPVDHRDPRYDANWQRGIAPSDDPGERINRPVDARSANSDPDVLRTQARVDLYRSTATRDLPTGHYKRSKRSTGRRR